MCSRIVEVVLVLVYFSFPPTSSLSPNKRCIYVGHKSMRLLSISSVLHLAILEATGLVGMIPHPPQRDTSAVCTDVSNPSQKVGKSRLASSSRNISRSYPPIPRWQPTRAPLRHGTRDAEEEPRPPPLSSSRLARLPDDVSIKHTPFPLNPTTHHHTTPPNPSGTYAPPRHSTIAQKQIPVSPHTRAIPTWTAPICAVPLTLCLHTPESPHPHAATADGLSQSPR